MKTVYVGMSADYIHAGHVYLLEEASKYGKITVGLLTDKAIASYKRIPMTSYEERKKAILGLKHVEKVIPQESLDYRNNLSLIKPDYVVHGDDWLEGTQKQTREKVVEKLKEWGGKVIDIKRIGVPSSTDLIEDELRGGVTPDYRRIKLKKLLELKPLVRIIEAHNGLSAIVAERTSIIVDGEKREFDGIWESSLSDSASKGKPDIEIVDFSSIVSSINDIIEVTTKPIIVDGDTGGLIQHFSYMVKTLERLGVSAVIIEDKKFPKHNSLIKDSSLHVQEDVDEFCKKISSGIQARITNDFMIIARIESMIIKRDLEDALYRAKKYIKAGADGIMIHSKDNDPKQIRDFCEGYKLFYKKVPLVAVPTTYNQITEKELMELGISVVIYANHLIRSSYKAMKKTAERILENKRTYEVNNLCCGVSEIFKLMEKK